MGRLKRLVVAGASLCLVTGLSACGTHPGSAAVVGSESISTDELDDVASALCSAQAGGQQSQQPQQDLASRAARQGALDVLVNSELSRQYGEEEGASADQQQITAAIKANQATIDSLPSKSRDVFRDTLEEYAEGQLMLIQLGGAALQASGSQQVAEEQALAEGTKLRNAWVEESSLDVSVDPRYGDFANGALVPQNGSLSVPVSTSATDGSADAPSQSWVASLPASQKCK